MTRPRKALISLADTPYYHITSRCVRRAFLCGVDHYSGQSYEHRRQWVVDRIRLLSSLFAIDVCAYAVMHNHYHLALKICPDQLERLSDDDVMDRWCALFKGPLLVQRYRDGEGLKPFERTTVSDIASVWRKRLASISWFMRCLNQPIARQANLEDNCTGKFWESRFTSQALKSEEALLSCMAYVDLNPVRAGIADTPESSSHTSIRERLRPEFNLQQAIDDQTGCGDLLDFKTLLKPLLPFEIRLINKPQAGILFSFEEYLSLVHISLEQWRQSTTQFEAIHPKRFNRIAPQFDTG